jgi:hypothetical protein
MQRMGMMLALACGLLAGNAMAQQAPTGSTTGSAAKSSPVQQQPVQLDTVVVSGALPGPGMWKVSKEGHVLWILGTVNAVPKRMQWESREVSAVLAQAQEVIWAPSVSMSAKIGFFQGLLLAPRALGARRNPDGKSLQDVVPADMYARWLPLKRKYIGSDRGIEQWRPIFAADKLYEEAMDDAGLARGGIVAPVVTRAIKARKLKSTAPQYKLVIADPKAALNELRQAQLDDVTCFGKSLDALETDLVAMRQRANAWAIGEIDALRSIPLSDQAEACMGAAMQSGIVRKRTQDDIVGEMMRRWVDAARTALANNEVTFAMMSLRDLLKAGGPLATLQAEGYAVEAPE